MNAAHADLVVKNGNIATLDGDHRFVSTLAARDGRIVATGDMTLVRRNASLPTPMIRSPW